MSSHLTPLEVCERLIAPVAKLGLLAGMRTKSAYAWQHGSQWRDAGDLPPRVNRRLLSFARGNGIPLTAEHLIFGAKRSDVENLLDQMKVAAE